MILDEVERHYVSVFGAPTRNARFKIDSYGAEVLKWDPGVATQGVALYASIGASRDPLHGRDRSHRVEFFIGFLPEMDSVAKPLAMVALDGILHGSALGPGATVTYPEPLWPGAEMRSFLVLRPVAEVIPALSLPDGMHVEFLQLIPLYASELDYKVARGEQALLRLWEQAGVPFWDPRRPAAVLAR